MTTPKLNWQPAYELALTEAVVENHQGGLRATFHNVQVAIEGPFLYIDVRTEAQRNETDGEYSYYAVPPMAVKRIVLKEKNYDVADSFA